MCSPSSVEFRQVFRPAFDEMDFCETADKITDILTYTLKKDSSDEKKSSIVLLLLQFLKENSEYLPGNAPVSCESWMQNRLQLLGCKQEAILTGVSIDTCVVVVSRFECEERFIEVLLEEREYTIIEGIGDTLGRWKCVNQSVIFVSKCLDVLLKNVQISCQKRQILHKLFLAKLDMILEQMPHKQCFIALKRLKRMYIAELYRELFSTFHFDIEPLVLLKTAFEMARQDIDVSMMTGSGDGKANLLKREISRSLESISLIQQSRMTEAFDIICKENIGILETAKSNHERIEVFKYGILFLENIDTKFRTRVCCDLEKSKETDIDIIWTQIINLLASEKFDNFSEITSSLLQLHDLQIMKTCHTFIELLDTWDNSTLIVIDSLPHIAKLFSPLICSAGFLIKMFTEIAELHAVAIVESEKQGTFDSLLSLVHNISKNAEFSVIKEVIKSCLDIFNCESLNYFTRIWCREKFLKQLNLVINQLSETNSENFHDLSHLSLLSPFDTLHELIRRGSSSAPLSKLVVKFLDQMTPLLFLHREKCEQKEVIIALANNFKRVEKEKCQVMADFISNLMKIKHVNGSKMAVSPFDILSHVLIPGLEEQGLKNTKGAPLSVLLFTFQSVLSMICNHEIKMNTRNYIDTILQGTVCMIQILSEFETEGIICLHLVHSERQQLHSTILNALKTIKLLCLDLNVSTMNETIHILLPSIQWQYRFYFLDLLHMPYSFQFPIPSPIFNFSTNYNSLQFYGDESLPTNIPCYLWILILTICKINMPIAQHFVEKILATSSPRILDLIAAVSQSLLESTNDGWKSVLTLIRTICQIGNPKLFTELSFDDLGSMSEVVKFFFYENSIITHSFLIVLNSLMFKDKQIEFAVTQKIEMSFINAIKELKESQNCDATNCFVILYKLASMLQKHMLNSGHTLDSVILQILETISNEDEIKMKSDEKDHWTLRYLDFKKYLVKY